jgi:hypothetical protein
VKQSIQLLHHALYASALLGALSFGASQAFATPEPSVAAKGPSCDPVVCNARCGGYGFCDTRKGCLCY